MSLVDKSIPILQRAILLTASLLCACNDDFFGFTGDAGDSTSTTDTGDPEPEPPREGFRVFPRYLLQDVPAVVTLERDAVPAACPYDDIGGGYVCDATGYNGGDLTVTVERDGFETATRHPIFDPYDIIDVFVHLAPLGGATGVWSDCVTAGAFNTCGDVCSDQMSTCTPASCATADPESPIATLETYADAECITAMANAAPTCDEVLPVGGATSLRCCCSN